MSYYFSKSLRRESRAKVLARLYRLFSNMYKHRWVFSAELYHSGVIPLVVEVLHEWAPDMGSQLPPREVRSATHARSKDPSRVRSSKLLYQRATRNRYHPQGQELQHHSSGGSIATCSFRDLLAPAALKVVVFRIRRARKSLPLSLIAPSATT